LASTARTVELVVGGGGDWFVAGAEHSPTAVAC
jgi:hypothetical protein